jgi:hypothetical protein
MSEDQLGGSPGSQSSDDGDAATGGGGYLDDELHMEGVDSHPRADHSGGDDDDDDDDDDDEEEMEDDDDGHEDGMETDLVGGIAESQDAVDLMLGDGTGHQVVPPRSAKLTWGVQSRGCHCTPRLRRPRASQPRAVGRRRCRRPCTL